MAVSAVDPTSAISASGTSSTSASDPSSTNALENLNSNDFLKMMIVELKNQDPLNPMDNSQLLQEISQMREITATTDMTSTLQAVLTGQNISSGSALIGKQVSALDDSGNAVTGRVGSASIAGGVVTLQIGNSSVKLSNVSQILP